MSDEVPFIPVGGRVLLKALPYRPSRLLEVFSHDNADQNESIVVALSECQYGRKYNRKKGWEHNGLTFPHVLKIGDRVLHGGTYQHDDTMTFNGVRYRCVDSWDIMGVLDAPQPEGYEDLKTGEMLPDKHPLLLH